VTPKAAQRRDYEKPFSVGVDWSLTAATIHFAFAFPATITADFRRLVLLETPEIAYFLNCGAHNVLRTFAACG
jgi:hypothetical protein